MRVLIVRITSMGDVVLTLPAVSDIVAKVPGIQIDWLVEKPFAAIPAMHPGVSRVISVQWRKWRKTLFRTDTMQALNQFRSELREYEYDLILDFQGQIAKSILLGSMARGPLVGFGWSGLREPLSSLFYRRRGAVSRSLHLVPRSRKLAAQLIGYAEPSSPPDYGILAPAPTWQVPGMLARESRDGVHARSGYAVLIPNASRPEKQWPQDRWIAVGAALAERGLAIVVLWGNPAEQLLANEIAQAVGASVPPFLSVAQVASLLAGAALVVGLDTGFTHLAVSLKRPTVGIYCDFDPALAGLVGSAYTDSLGGVGLIPPLRQVLESISKALPHA